MTAEIHRIAYGYGNAFVARSELQKILGQNLPIDTYVDTRTVLNVITKNASTLEKRLQIDVRKLRKSHTRDELHYLA